MSEILVQFDGVVAKFPTFHLQVPAWEVRSGEVVGVVGPNGAGKSTLLKLIPALLSPARGTVRVFGLDPLTHPVEVRSRLGFFQESAFGGSGKISKVLRLLSGYYPSWDHGYAQELLTRFELDADAEMFTLSKGQRQRMRLVCVMAHRPDLLVLDEPAAGLDLAGRRLLLETVLSYMQREGCATIISSHQLLDIHRLADRLLVLGDGQIVHDGATHEVVPDQETLEEAMVRWSLA